MRESTIPNNVLLHWGVSDEQSFATLTACRHEQITYVGAPSNYQRPD